MRCSRCGTQNAPQARFCSNCALPFAAVAAVPERQHIRMFRGHASIARSSKPDVVDSGMTRSDKPAVGGQQPIMRMDETGNGTPITQTQPVSAGGNITAATPPPAGANITQTQPATPTPSAPITQTPSAPTSTPTAPITKAPPPTPAVAVTKADAPLPTPHPSRELNEYLAWLKQREARRDNINAVFEQNIHSFLKDVQGLAGGMSLLAQGGELDELRGAQGVINDLGDEIRQRTQQFTALDNEFAQRKPPAECRDLHADYRAALQSTIGYLNRIGKGLDNLDVTELPEGSASDRRIENQLDSCDKELKDLFKGYDISRGDPQYFNIGDN